MVKNKTYLDHDIIVTAQEYSECNSVKVNLVHKASELEQLEYWSFAQARIYANY